MDPESARSPARWRDGEVARVLGLVLIVAAVLAGIGSRALWDIDEGMHAAMAREMVQSGDWLTPRFNAQPFFDKPVLFTWLCALSMRVLGFTELAARLPGALLGLGTVLATYALGRRAYGPRAGFLGASTLATSCGFVLFSSVVVHDVCLTFFVTLCLVLLQRALEEERHRRVLVLLACAAAGLAFLAKGPVGVALPAGIALAYLLLSGRLALLGRLGLGWGVLVFLAVASPWYVLMALEHPDYLRHFFLEQNLGYLASAESRHVKPAWFYVPALVYELFPWSFFLPAALWSVRPARSTEGGRTTLFLLCWAGLTFALFSAAKSKLPGYILPLLPPLALLVGVAWSRLAQDPAGRSRRGFLAGSAALFVLAALGAGFVLVRPLARLQERYGISPQVVAVVAVLLALALGVSFALLARSRVLAAFATLTATVIGLFAAFALVFAPQVDLYRSAKAIAGLLDERLPPGESLVSYGDMIGDGDSALYYTGRGAIVLQGEQEVGEHLDEPLRVFAMVSLRNAKHMGRARARAYVLARVGNLMLVSNRPDAPGDPRGIPER